MNMMVSAAALTTSSKATAAVQPDDSALLELEEKIFEHYAAATAYDDEICRLHDIWLAELKRLWLESLIALHPLTEEERWRRVRAMPESEEYNRLVNLQDAHWAEQDSLIQKMWGTPAHGPEGRRAKVMVLLGAVLGDNWREHDGEANYEIRRARDLMFEFVGGEPAVQMRDQFRAEPGTLLS